MTVGLGVFVVVRFWEHPETNNAKLRMVSTNSGHTRPPDMGRGIAWLLVSEAGRMNPEALAPLPSRGYCLEIGVLAGLL